MLNDSQKSPEPCECTVSVMTEEAPKVDVNRFLKASKTVLLLRGLAFLIFGILMMTCPTTAVAAIVIVMGVYVLIDGIAMLRAATSTPQEMRPLWLTNAIVLILLGIFAIFSPLVMGKTAIILFGIWQLLTGLQCLLIPAQSGRKGSMLSGVLSILVGLAFVGAPLFGMAVMGWLFGCLILFSGIMMLTAGFMIK